MRFGKLRHTQNLGGALQKLVETLTERGWSETTSAHETVQATLLQA